MSLVLFAAGAALFWIGHRRHAPTGPDRPLVTTPQPVDASAPRRRRAPSRDVTFYAVSDTHFGFVPEADHTRLVAALDAMAGQPYPAPIGGTVATPRALLITGDLTEWGQEDEWKRFLAFYGNLSPTSTKVPVFEVIGNHDKIHGPWVGERVAERHGGSPYAFDFDDVHFVALGEAPDDRALEWLAADLDRTDRDVPVVVYFHLALLGPWSDGNWFAERDYKDRLARLLEGRCVAAIFHGHHHATGRYDWHGMHVYKPGAVKDGAHTFAVVRIVNSTFTLASWDWDTSSWRPDAEQRDLCP